jgi:TatD DNase family protein
MRYIDSHSHLYFSQFDADRDEVVARMRAEQVTTIAVGTGFHTSRQAAQSVIEMSDVILGATVGVHPTAYREGFRDEDFESLFKNHERIESSPRLVVGVGECGLDYFRGN